MIRSGSATRRWPKRTMSRSRVREPQRSALHAALGPLDGLAGLEQRPRLESGLEQHHLIEIRRAAPCRRAARSPRRRTPPPAGCRAARRARREPPPGGPRGRRGCCPAPRTPARPRRPPPSGLHHEVAGDPLQIGRHLAQLADGALQVGLPRRGFAGAAGQGLGLREGAGRARRPRGGSAR